MVFKVYKIYLFLDDVFWDKGVLLVGLIEYFMMVCGLDCVLLIQCLFVLVYICSICFCNLYVFFVEIICILECCYFVVVIIGGVVVGVIVVVFGIGIGIMFVFFGVEIVGFVELIVLFVQLVVEVYGIVVVNFDCVRVFVMMLMFGKEGVDLVVQFVGQVVGWGVSRLFYWGELVIKLFFCVVVGLFVDQFKGMFVKQFVVKGGVLVIGKVFLFGIGVVVGGVGNYIFGCCVFMILYWVFGVVFFDLFFELEFVLGVQKFEFRMLWGVCYVGGVVVGVVGIVVCGVGWVGYCVGDFVICCGCVVEEFEVGVGDIDYGDYDFLLYFGVDVVEC